MIYFTFKVLIFAQEANYVDENLISKLVDLRETLAKLKNLVNANKVFSYYSKKDQINNIYIKEPSKKDNAEIMKDAKEEPELVDSEEMVPKLESIIDGIDGKKDYLEYRLELERYTYVMGRIDVNEENIGNLAVYVFTLVYTIVTEIYNNMKAYA